MYIPIYIFSFFLYNIFPYSLYIYKKNIPLFAKTKFMKRKEKRKKIPKGNQQPDLHNINISYC